MSKSVYVVGQIRPSLARVVKTPHSVSVNIFSYTLNPWENLQWDKEETFQQYVSIFHQNKITERFQ